MNIKNPVKYYKEWTWNPLKIESLPPGESMYNDGQDVRWKEALKWFHDAVRTNFRDDAIAFRVVDQYGSIHLAAYKYENFFQLFIGGINNRLFPLDINSLDEIVQRNGL